MSMNPLSVGQTLWDLVTRDAAIWGGVRSPLLSWIGAAGILGFCLWHLARLRRDVGQARRSYARLWPTLERLASARRQVDDGWLVIRAFADTKERSRQGHPRPPRIDLDDVHELDALLRREPLFAKAWMQFRKTYLLEHTSWFIEPRVFSTRPAAEYFAPEGLFNGRLNLAFYHQLPSLMTGIGLLFTFLAILIGLSKLHADGSQIMGIQGLINGLAGKFLTSVVGLVCANGFVMLEQSWMFGLTTSNHQFVTVLDELFPRRTMEQLLENRSPTGPDGQVMAIPQGGDLAERVGATVTDRLMPSVSALTSAVQSLGRRGEDEPSVKHHRVAAEVARGVGDALTAPMRELRRAIEDLAHSLGDFKASHERTRQELEDLAGRLTNDLSHLGQTFDREDRQAIGSGFRWLTSLRPRTAAKEAD